MQAYSPRLFGKIYVRTVTYLKRRNVMGGVNLCFIFFCSCILKCFLLLYV